MLQSKIAVSRRETLWLDIAQTVLKKSKILRIFYEGFLPINLILKFSTFTAHTVYQHFIIINVQIGRFIRLLCLACGKVSLTAANKIVDICFTQNVSLLLRLVF
ncbi:hypothetical protein DI53_1245 [Sphingobacterium deserti]|uniref:Uncharacterized protein n=1 Tax=Sphingobacterium deserti TaxID=1229276 RepID=A0A0B8T4P1_9SPHI|nr:hypothetical protein DI53_1245 [Sphingobacterium deserti]